MENFFLKKGKTVVNLISGIIVFSMITGMCCKVANASEENEINSDKPIAGFCVKLSDDQEISTEVAKIMNEKIKEKEQIKNDKTKQNKAVVNTADKKVDENKKIQDEIIPKSKAVKEEKETKVAEKAKKIIIDKNVGIVTDEKVNIRSEASAESNIVGKMAKGTSAEIISSSNGWYKIKSGTVSGYIKKDLLTTGNKIYELAEKYAKKIVKVNVNTLNVRENKDENSAVVLQLGEKNTGIVLEDTDTKWIKISADGKNGYVVREYVTIKMDFEKAVSYKEEKNSGSEKKTQSTEKKTQNTEKKTESTEKKTESTEKKTESTEKKTQSTEKKESASNSSGTTGQDIVNYAMKFLGNRYVYGGTSLTNGTDCSGFTQSIYRHFGYSLSRTSSSQSSDAGRVISTSSLQKGDLLFYTGSSGRVNHVAIYIGGGRIIHASNPSDGIKTSSYNYRTPCKARRILN